MSKKEENELMSFGGKSAKDMMMQYAPDINDYKGNGRPGSYQSQQVDQAAYGKAQSEYAASLASGDFMTDTVDYPGMPDKRKKDGKDPMYRNPLLAQMANEGYTFNDIQSAGNALGLKSFNSENDISAIKTHLQQREGAYAEGLVSDLEKKLEEDKQEPEAEAAPAAKEYSPAMQEAVERVRNYEASEDFSGEGVFRAPNEGVATEIADVASTSKANAAPKGDDFDQKSQASQNLLDKFKLDLKTNRRFE